MPVYFHELVCACTVHVSTTICKCSHKRMVRFRDGNHWHSNLGKNHNTFQGQFVKQQF